MKVHLEKPNWIYPAVQQKQSYLNVGLPKEFLPPFKVFSDVNSGLHAFLLLFPFFLIFAF